MPHATIEIELGLVRKGESLTITRNYLEALSKSLCKELEDDLKNENYSELENDGGTIFLDGKEDPSVTTEILVWSFSGENTNMEHALEKHLTEICEEFNRKMNKQADSILEKKGLASAYSELYIEAEVIDCQAEEEYDGEGGYLEG
jgi:hypothetical protein